MKKVMLIDLMNMFIRSFAVLPFTNDNGEHTGAFHGTLQSIVSGINRFKPDHVYVAFEGKGSSERRRRLLKEYKEGRKFTGFNRKIYQDDDEERKAFADQLRKLKEILVHLPFNSGSVEFLEADDLIAYLCRKLLKDYRNVIVSNDRDYWQLINDNTCVFRPVKTKASPGGELIISRTYETGQCISTLNVDKCEEVKTVLCHPQNYGLLKCFGEPSDNIEGIKGIGEKTILRDFPFLYSLKDDTYNYTINDLIEYASKQTAGKYKKYILPENVEILQRNEKLIQLLEPDISLKSVQTIENTLKKSMEFNPYQFRINLLKENISLRNIDKWLSAFNSIKCINQGDINE